MVKTENNPDGLPKEVFDDLQIRFSPTVHNFSETYHLVRSMVLTDLMQSHLKVLLLTGGVRA